MKADEIINGGTDISEHYLLKGSPYKIVRYNRNVYAVSLDENKEPSDVVHLWKSNNKNNQVVEKRLGHGVRGIVSQKTEDKVKKTPVGFMGAAARQPREGRGQNARRPMRQRAGNSGDQLKDKNNAYNNKILGQRFALKEKGLDSIFTFGLHSIKNLPQQNVFFMPKLTKDDPRSRVEKELYVDFLLKLKQVNEMGLAHDDYCGTAGCKATNFANAMLTKDGYQLIDMDNGLHEIDSNVDDIMRPLNTRLRDQWFLAYLNRKYPDQVNKMEDWYQKNEYNPISESPDAIRQFIADNNIKLPQKMLDNLEPGMTQSVVAASSSSSNEELSSSLASENDLKVEAASSSSSNEELSGSAPSATEKFKTVSSLVATKADFQAMRDAMKAIRDEENTEKRPESPRPAK